MPKLSLQEPVIQVKKEDFDNPKTYGAFVDLARVLRTTFNRIADAINFLYTDGSITTNLLDDDAVTEAKAAQVFKDLLLSNVEDWHEVGSGGGEPAFENGWVNYGSVEATAAFYKDPWGRVHIKGLVKTGTINTTIFTLPVDYRPPANLIFNTQSNNVSARLNTTLAGVVSGTNGSSNLWISINCSFIAA